MQPVAHDTNLESSLVPSFIFHIQLPSPVDPIFKNQIHSLLSISPATTQPQPLVPAVEAATTVSSGWLPTLNPPSCSLSNSIHSYLW